MSTLKSSLLCRKDLQESYEGLSTFFCFDNHPRQPHNTCGQAVIASMISFYAMQLERAERNDHEPDSAIFDRVLAEHGPNWPFSNGVTTPGILKRALQAYDLKFRDWRTVFGGRDLAESKLIYWTGVCKNPTIVLLDVHRANLGPRFHLHWAVVFAVSRHSVRLATWGKVLELPWDIFLDSWKCRFLPPPFRYYMIGMEEPS